MLSIALFVVNVNVLLVIMFIITILYTDYRRVLVHGVKISVANNCSEFTEVCDTPARNLSRQTVFMYSNLREVQLWTNLSAVMALNHPKWHRNYSISFCGQSVHGTFVLVKSKCVKSLIPSVESSQETIDVLFVGVFKHPVESHLSV